MQLFDVHLGSVIAFSWSLPGPWRGLYYFAYPSSIVGTPTEEVEELLNGSRALSDQCSYDTVFLIDTSFY